MKNTVITVADSSYESNFVSSQNFSTSVELPIHNPPNPLKRILNYIYANDYFVQTNSNKKQKNKNKGGCHLHK